MLTIPDEIWLEFKEIVPEGKRSETISTLIKTYVLKKRPKKEISFWQEIKKYREGDYSHEDSVELAKHAWDEIIDRY